MFLCHCALIMYRLPSARTAYMGCSEDVLILLMQVQSSFVSTS